MLGLSEGAIRKAIKAGRISVLADGLIDVEAAASALARNTDFEKKHRPRVSSPPPTAPENLPEMPEPPASPIYEQRTRVEAARAQLLEIELQEKRETLIQKAATEVAYGAKISATRDGLLSVADRLTPILAAESDPLKIHAILTAAIIEAMRLLSVEAPRPAS